MAWQILRRRDRKHLEAFLRIREWGHVGFSSRIIRSDESALTVYVNRINDDGAITEAILHTAAGLIIPALSDEGHGIRDDIRSLFYRNGASGRNGLPPKLRRLHSIMGLRTDVETIQEALDTRCQVFIDYHTMTSTGMPVRSANDRAITCKMAKPRDAKMLFPLQKAYEIEEVLLNPARFDPRGCMLALQRSLRREIVMYAVQDGRTVAKAGTNAIGFGYAQLGGVYTLEEYRNRGVGECILRALMKRIQATGRDASLFVKKDNPAAIQLYRKLDFITRSDFRIAYYR